VSTSSTFYWNIPVVLTETGLQPQSPTSLNEQLIADAVAQVPDLTTNLPGSLVEDVASTGTGGLLVCDSAKVELINSLTPYGANIFLLQQLGQIYLGQSQPGLATNTSVELVFSGTVGFVIPNGLLVSDGTHQYQVQTGGVIGTGGTSGSISAIATQTGSWAVNANTVTTIQTSIPNSISLSVTNPSAGTPGGTAETWASFRTRILQAGLAVSVSTPRYIKTLVGVVLGAQSNLISVQQATNGLRVVVGGSADPYQVANAIFMSVANPAQLQGSAVSSTRNVTVSLVDYPDTYSIVYVAAPTQTVTMTVACNSTLTSFTGWSAFPGLIQQPLADYVNALGIGQPMNILVMNEIVQNAVEAILDSSLLTRVAFSISINGVLTNPATGTYAVSGDPESAFTCTASGITVNAPD
jgi:hypothetical protein